MSEESIVESLVDVSRVTKVVKGGRRFSFSACVVSGDRYGKVGYGHGKAKEVAEARIKAANEAKNRMIKVPLYDQRTIHHDVYGKSGAAFVLLRKAKPGTGVIAGGAMRTIFDLLGVHDIVAKSLGSSNVYSLINATFDALSKLSTPKVIAGKRNISLKEVGNMKNNEQA